MRTKWSLSRLGFALVSCVLFLGIAGAASAEDAVVSDCGDSGLSTQLRAKLLLAQERDDLNLSFSCPGPILLTKGVLPSINLNVTIDGGDDIVLSGNNASRLFDVASGASLTLTNLTISNGNVDGYGGAIYNDGALTIINTRFLDNRSTLAGNGGAIISFGALVIQESEFAGNEAANGGALYVTGASSITSITNSEFHDNAAIATNFGWGGAIYASAGAQVTVESSAIHANSAQSGGGVYVYEAGVLTRLTVSEGATLSQNVVTGIGGAITSDGQLSLQNATVMGNRAESGAGIYSANGFAALTNVTLSENIAQFSGGGLFSTEGDASLTNVTVSGNTAHIGGGVYNALGDLILTNVTLYGNVASLAGGIYHEGGGALLKNTIVASVPAADEAENCFGVQGGDFNLSDDFSCGFGTGRDGVDPRLGPLAANGGPTQTHLPQPDSPAIDGGTGAGCPATDQRGISRTASGTGVACDVGATEYQAAALKVYLPHVERSS